MPDEMPGPPPEVIGSPAVEVGVNWEDRAFFVVYLRQTNIYNVKWHRGLAIRLGWPPFRHSAGFIIY